MSCSVELSMKHVDKLETWPMVTVLFSYSTQQRNINFFMLVNIKMSSIVGILTLASMMNTLPECFKVRKYLLFHT